MGRFHLTLARFVLISVLATLFAQPQFNVFAVASMTITPITWNVVGLDSNNVNLGPNNFPVGARVCNTSTAGETLTNVVVDFIWDDGSGDYTGDTYINLRSGSYSAVTFASIASGTCEDAYFEVTVTRDAGAYNQTRDYHITADSNETTLISTPTPREIFVERLVSQNRNAVTDILLDGVSIAPGGTMNLNIGQTYTITLVGATATNGYEQIESFINFPNTIFQINSVAATYTAFPTPHTDADWASKLYADGCGWVNDPNDVTTPVYRECTGTGKYGGDVTLAYDVTIIATSASSGNTLNTLIYDFSGSSYHYNSDFSTSSRVYNIIDPNACIQSTIAAWNFNSSLTAASTDNANGVPAITANALSVAGSVAGFSGAAGDDARSHTSWSTANLDTTTDYLQFDVSTEGYYNVSFSYDLYRSNQGPTNVTAAYDDNGVGTPTTLTTDALGGTTWTSYSKDLTAISSLDNAAGSRFLIYGHNAGGTAGTLRVDNFTVVGCKLPASISLAKSGNPAYFTAAGQTITYTYTITNTGQISVVSPYTVTDDKIASANISCAGAVSPLAPGASTTCTGTYTTVGQDVTNGLVTNNASVDSATVIGDDVDTNTATETVEYAALNVVKEVSTSSAGPWTDTVTVDVGTTIYYQISVDNIGNAELTGITINDGMAACTLSGPTGDTDTDNNLDVTETWVYTCSITALAGSNIVNTAIVDSNETLEDTDTASYTGRQADLIVTKTNNVSGTVLVNNSFNWVITVTNNGLATASFADTQTLMSDTLPGVAGYYPQGALTVTPGGTAPTGTIACSITGTSLSCVASGGAVSLPAGASFSVTFAVTPTAAGSLANTATVDPNGNITESDETNNTGSDTVTVLAPPSISKNFSPDPIAPGGTSTLTFTLTNSNTGTALAGVAFSDTYPAAITNVNPLATSNTCGGTLTATAGGGSVALSGGSIAANSSCTITIDVTSSTAGTHTNTTGTVSSTNGGTGNTASDTLTVLASPSISKNYAPDPIAVGGTSTLTFTITNSNTGTALTGIAFTDSFPTGTEVASTPNATISGCGVPTFAPTAGATSISFTGGTIIANGTCTVTVDVTATTSGTKNNTSGSVSSTNAGTGNTATDTLTVLAPPVLAKSFSPSPIASGGTSTLTISIINPNAGTALTGVAVSDTYPAGITNATPLTTTNTCGGTLTATAGGGSLALSGGSVAAADSCSITILVTSSTVGTHNNTTGNVSSTNAGTGNTSSDTLTVLSAPSIAKNFSPDPIASGGTSTLTFTLTNSNTTTALTGVAFTDTYPTEINNTTPLSTTNTCGGTLTATAGGGSIALAGGTIAANSSCTITLDVTSSTAGTHTNTTGNITSTNGGTGNTATDTLTVVDPPSIAKNFSPDPIASGGTSTLTFTLTNSNTTTALTGIAFTDTYPAAITNVTPLNTTNSCGGTLTATAGGGSIVLSGGSIPANSTCTITVDVTSSTAGTHTNTTGNVSSTNGGTGNTAIDSLTVVAPPSIAKSFSPDPITSGGTSTLTITITNSNTATALTGVAFTDTYPVAITNVNPLATSNTCGGTLTATAGGGSIALSGGSIAANSSCTITIDVTSSTVGTHTNTTGTVSSTNGGTGNTTTDTLTVVAPPSIAKNFSPDPIPSGGTSTLTFTLTNLNTGTTLTGVAFSDTYPATITNTTPLATTNTCGGTLTATAGGGSIVLSGGSIPANSTCTITVDVTSSTLGTHTNTSGNVSSTNGGTGNTATDTLTVLSTPSIAKGFSPDPIASGGTSTLTFTLNNPNTGTALTGVAFNDTYPIGMTNVTPLATTNTCGGTLTATAGIGSISLAGGTIAANGSCTITVDVTSSTVGTHTNTSGNVSSTNGGTGNTATNTLTVVAPPSITKDFSPDPITVGGTSTLTFTITNSNIGTALTSVAFTDSFPVGTEVAAPPNTTTTNCGAPTFAPVPGATSIAFSGGAIAANGTCTVTVDVTATTAGVKNNTTSNVSSANGGTGNTASDTLTVLAPPSISKNFSPDPIPSSGTSTLTFTLTNSNTTTALTGIAFTDTYPTEITNTTPLNTTNTCGGALTATAGGGSISLSGGSIPVNSTCTITVDVTSTTIGTHTNTSGAVSSTNGGIGNTATDTLTVIAPPSISKNFLPDPILLNDISTLTFTLTNTNTGSALTGVVFSDTYPAGIVNATPLNTTNTCGGTLTATAGGGSISLAGGTIPVNDSCTITIDIVGTTTGTKTNTTGTISSTNGGTGNTGTDTLTVNPKINVSLDKQVSNTTPNVDDVVTFTLVIANAGPSTATNIVVTDVIPAGYAYVTNSITGGNSRNDASPAGTGLTWTINSLASGASVNLTYQVTVLDTGPYDNYAEITSHTETDSNSTPGNASTLEDDDDTQIVNVPQFAISKVADVASVNAAGAIINYTITLTNTGTITLTGVSVSDPLLTDLDCDGTPGVPRVTIGLTINVASSLSCTGSYTVTQTDMDNNGGGDGDIDNIATGDTAETPNKTASATVLINQNPDFTIIKSITSAGPYDSAGDVIIYSIVLQNTGNITLAGVSASDPLLTDLDCDGIPGAPRVTTGLTINVASSLTCTGSYTLTQADLDNNGGGDGDIDNTATGDTNETPSQTSSAAAPLTITATLGINKEISSDNATWVNSVTVTAGDTVYFRVQVSNTGNTILTGLTVSDSMAPSCTLIRGTDVIGNNDNNFEVGETWLYTCSLSALLGTTTNTATADTTQTAPQTDTAQYTANTIPAPALNVVKSGTLDMTVIAPNGQADAGDVINYTITVQNMGNTVLTGVSVTDLLITGTLDCDGIAGAPLVTTGLTINVGNSLTCTGIYTLTQVDLNSNGGGDGDIDNTATADSNETPPDDDPNEVPIPLAPALQVDKTLNSSTFINPNTLQLDYTITLANTGNVTLTNLQVTDNLVTPFITTGGAVSVRVVSVTSADFTVNPGFDGDTDQDLLTGADTLAVGTSGTINLMIEVDTGGDEDDYINTAVGTGTPPSGPPVTDDGVAGAPSFVDPALSKAANPLNAPVGSPVTFTITVRNNGNLPALNVTVNDPLPAVFDVTAVNITVAGPPIIPAPSFIVTPPIGGTAPFVVDVNIGTLGVANVVTIEIVTVVNSLGAPPIINTATLATTSPTDNALNNVSAVPITIPTPGGGGGFTPNLPDTGFAPNEIMALPAQPNDLVYVATDVILEIPSLGVKTTIVGVPLKKDGWDVAWLANQAGWLEGSAFPSWKGNSVLTGHVYGANGLPGPFVDLSKLKYGDKIIVHVNGQKYIYEVRTMAVVAPNDKTVFRHEELSWLTLITCKEYDAKTKTYKQRLIVRAVLVKVEK